MCHRESERHGNGREIPSGFVQDGQAQQEVLKSQVVNHCLVFIVYLKNWAKNNIFVDKCIPDNTKTETIYDNCIKSEVEACFHQQQKNVLSSQF